jgi:hypothetical protein
MACNTRGGEEKCIQNFTQKTLNKVIKWVAGLDWIHLVQD